MPQSTRVEYNEEQIALMARHSSMLDVMVGVHNACSHGDIFEETGEEVDDDKLLELFKHFDAILALLRY